MDDNSARFLSNLSDMDQAIEATADLAKMAKSYFTALLAADFTRAEALVMTVEVQKALIVCAMQSRNS